MTEFDFNFNSKCQSEALTELLDEAIVAHKSKEDPRTYLGGSRLGVSCGRQLQYEYTKTPKDIGKNFSGRLYRIFERGHKMEDMMAQWLQLAGFDLRTHSAATGRQFGFAVAQERIAGHIDGVICGGPIKNYKYPLLWEHKALGSKSFNSLKRKRLKKDKPVYYVQCNVYMAYMQLESALFTALNADTMDIYAEVVPFDQNEAQRASDRGVAVLQAVDSGQLLPRSFNSPDYAGNNFEGCKFCDWCNRCWEIISKQSKFIEPKWTGK